MSWAKVDDKLFVHPKFLAVSFAGRGLWLTCLSYAASLERDGWFPTEVLTTLASPELVDPLVHELVHATLWIREADGYRFHDYLRYNPSRKQIAKYRKDNAKRKRLSRLRHAVTPRGVTRESQRPDPTRPVPSQLALASLERRRRSRTLPDSESLTPERLQMAREAGLSEEEARRQWRLFSLHEFRDPHSDWDRAWKTWCLRSAEFGRTRPAPSAGRVPGPTVEETKRLLERL